MKLSEFIRAAVDKHLWNGVGENPRGKPFATKKSIGLCGAFRRLAYAMGGTPESGAMADRALELVAQLPEYEFDLAGYLRMPEDATWEDKQAIRFMYSEFLALYLEDFEDGEEIKEIS